MTDVTRERWLPVVGWDGYYEVSDEGRVRSIDRIVSHRMYKSMHLRGKMLSGCPSATGYLSVSLSSGNKHQIRKVHRLVAFAFLGDPVPGQEVCHNDGDPSNNVVSNLRWDTSSENRYDSVSHGTHPQASKDQCPWGHLLQSPNLTYSGRPYRTCLACSRGKAHASRHPGLDLQKTVDMYYAALMIREVAV